MSFTFKTDPAREGESSVAQMEPTTRIYVDNREVGVIVFDEEDAVYDIWVAIKDPSKRIGWRWTHCPERPSLLARAQQKALDSYAVLAAQHTFHFHP